MSDNNEFVEVTELGGDNVSPEQVERIFHRYIWSSFYCQDKDVLEVGCGTGQGLGYLLKVSNSLSAGDYSRDILKIASDYYQDRVELKRYGLDISQEGTLINA